MVANCSVCGRQDPGLHAKTQCHGADCPWLKPLSHNETQAEIRRLRIKNAELRELLEEAFERSQEAGDLNATEIVWRVYTEAALGHYEPDEKPRSVVALVAAVMHWRRIKDSPGVTIPAIRGAEQDMRHALAALDEDL